MGWSMFTCPLYVSTSFDKSIQNKLTDKVDRMENDFL